MLSSMALKQFKKMYFFKIRLEKNVSRVIEAYLCRPNVPGAWFKNHTDRED